MKLYPWWWLVTLLLICLLVIFVSMSVNRALKGTTILDTKIVEVEEILAEDIDIYAVIGQLLQLPYLDP